MLPFICHYDRLSHSICELSSLSVATLFEKRSHKYTALQRTYLRRRRQTDSFLFVLFIFFDVVDVFVRANSLFARFSPVSLSLSQYFVLATTVLDFFCSALSVRCNTSNLFGRSIGHPSPTPPVRLSVATFHIFVILFVYRHRPFAPFQRVCLCFCWSSSTSDNRMTD